MITITAVLAVIMLIACSSGLYREQIAREKFQSIPQLPSSVLVSFVSGIDGGSSESCYSGYVDALYGTSTPKSEVIAFYHQYVQNDEWAVNTEATTDLGLFASNRQEDYGLAVIVITPIGPTEVYYPSKITKKDIENALSRFSTVYLILVSYHPDTEEC